MGLDATGKSPEELSMRKTVTGTNDTPIDLPALR